MIAGFEPCEIVGARRLLTNPIGSDRRRGRTQQVGLRRFRLPNLDRDHFDRAALQIHESQLQRRRFEDLWNEMGASSCYEIWLAKIDEVLAGFCNTIWA